jgi:potassium-transporting ATPase KdpC subunit
MKILSVSIRIFLFFTIVTGFIYPFLITGIAQLVFPKKANGSLILNNNKIIGSELIGQTFDSAKYFSSRPSAITYNPLPSGGSNYGLTNSKLKRLLSERRSYFIEFNNLDSTVAVPSEMLFASASGLDPHISPDAALLQVEHVAKARHLNGKQKIEIIKCIHELTEEPQIMCLGEKRINVLMLNIAIDKLQGK